jgi:hypothetical protein
MMKRLALLIILTLFAVLASLQAAPVNAQSYAADEYYSILSGCYEFDFKAIDEQDWTVWDRATYRRGLGTYVAGAGWRTEVFGSSNQSREVNIIFDFGRQIPVTSFTYYNRTTSGGSQRLSYNTQAFLLNGIGPLDTRPSDLVWGRPPAQHIPSSLGEYGWDFPSPMLARYAGIVVSFNNGNPVTIEYVQICVPPPPEDDLYRPYTLADEDAWGIYDKPNGHYGAISYAFSNNPGDFVHAPTSGRIARLERLRTSYCQLWQYVGLSAAARVCDITIPSSVHGGNGDYVYDVGDYTNWRDFAAIGRTYVENVYIVGLFTDEGQYFEYWVQDAPDYVALQTYIEGGCYLGKSISLTTWNINLNWPPTPDSFLRLADQGVAFILHSEEFSLDAVLEFPELMEWIPASPKLTVYPPPGEACNADPEFRTCYGDAQLQDLDEWTVTGTVSANDPGVIMQPNSTISTTMLLNAENSPAVTVGARTVAGTGRIRVLLGTLDETFTLTRDTINYTVDSDPTPPAPDVGSFFTVAVSNTSGGTIEVAYVCVRDNASENPPPTPPPPFIEECNSDIPQPTTDTFSHQIGWHWAKLNQFHQCDLMRILNNIDSRIRNFVTLFGFVTRYWMAVADRYATWIGSDAVGWLNGHFANMANGRTVVINNTGAEGCNNVFCLFREAFRLTGRIIDTVGRIVPDLLRFLGSFFDNLFAFLDSFFSRLIEAIQAIALRLLDLADDLIQRIIDFVQSLVFWIMNFIDRIIFALLELVAFIVKFVLDMLFVFGRAAVENINFAGNLLGALIDSYFESEPLYIMGMNCQQNPRASVLCVGVWVLDNTIFADDSPGIILMYIIIAVGSAMGIAWIITDIKKALIEAAKVL